MRLSPTKLLHIYVEDIEKVKQYIKEGADVNYGSFDSVKYLCEKGANTEQICEYGHTPLSIAAQGGHLEIVKYLCKIGADTEHVTGANSTPLHWVLHHAHFEIVKFLCDFGVNMMHGHKESGTPLTRLHKPDVGLRIVNFFHKKGFDVNCISEDNEETPLLNAVWNFDVGNIGYLYRAGAKFVHPGGSHVFVDTCRNGSDTDWLIAYIKKLQNNPIIPLSFMCINIVYAKRIPHDHMSKVLFDRILYPCTISSPN